MRQMAIGRGDARREAAGRRRWELVFRRLWVAQTVALFGAEVTTLALPLTAALILGASPLQMGLLVAAGEAPFLLWSLPLGVFADRVRRRPLLVAADIGRAALLGIIPVTALLGVLRIELLYVVAFLAGMLSVLFEIAHYAYVPSLIPRDQLVAANGKLQVSYSAAESAGPGLAGLLIQAVTAPIAVLATAGSFLVSALLLGTLDQTETRPRGDAPGDGFWRAARDGLRALLNHPLLRPIVVTSAAIGLFLYAVRAIYVLYATRELGLDSLQLGTVIAIGGAAAVPGGLLAGWFARRFGFGLAVGGGWLLEGLALLLIPLATPATALPVLALAQTCGGLAGTITNVNQWSLRQAVTPDHLQGRVTASHRFLVYGAFPVGALLGGVLATRLGMRPALLIGGVGAAICPLWFLWRVRGTEVKIAGTSDDVVLGDQGALGEAGRAEGGDVDPGRGAVEQELGQTAADRGTLHEAVAAEPGRDGQTLRPAGPAQERVVIGGDLVEPGPAAQDARLREGGRAGDERFDGGRQPALVDRLVG
jgi:MFS family permease